MLPIKEETFVKEDQSQLYSAGGMGLVMPTNDNES